MLPPLFKFIVKTFYREVSVKGLETLPHSGPVIFAPNHPNSLIDPLLLHFFPADYKIRFVAKAPLFDIPLLGRIMRAMKAIPVVRKFEAKGKIDYEAFFAACVDALADGGSITIFPEGVSLPQPHMAELKTGVARLFFMARERDIDVRIVPVGLNYEQGSIFRSSVVVWAAAPLDTSDFVEKHRRSPQAAVRELTDHLRRALAEHVFQTENILDRELMFLLERIYGEQTGPVSWSERFERLKQFEAGLRVLRPSCASKIDRLRHMLSRYDQMSRSLEDIHHPPADNTRNSRGRFILALIGLPVACLGWLFSILPYTLCDYIIKHVKKYNDTVAATYKIIYSLFLFPLCFFFEALLLQVLFGWTVSAAFAIGIIPLCYFTLFYLEWIESGNWDLRLRSPRLNKFLSHQLSRRLEVLRGQINALVDDLAARVEGPLGNDEESM
jgi:glycerol-3-phosphate O-acyltransferase/dihydroxyacetone phosphate acyltransferase